MIIDQLPLLAGNALATDEIPLERGTTTYKAELSQLFGSVYDTLEPNFAGAYDETSTYAVGDYVVYEHNLYVCNTAISTAEEWTAAHWTQISVADELLNVATELLALDTNKQDTLVSGTNIKTVGGQSLLGSGNIEAGGGVNRNLLDNWYFVGGGSQLGYGVFPVNQRGQTSYSTTGYCIDRWKLTSGSVTLSSSGITLNGTVVQILPKSIGLPVVASALLSDGTMITPTYNDSTKTFTLTASNKTIVAVKLEIGDTQTLAHEENGVWVVKEIPDFDEELSKCQKYLRVASWDTSAWTTGYGYGANATTINIFFPFDGMVANPTISPDAGSNWIIRGNSSSITPSKINAWFASPHCLGVKFTVTGATTNAVYAAHSNSGTNVIFSAEP